MLVVLRFHDAFCIHLVDVRSVGINEVAVLATASLPVAELISLHSRGSGETPAFVSKSVGSSVRMRLQIVSIGEVAAEAGSVPMLYSRVK
jgi:hypothetical protein